MEVIRDLRVSVKPVRRRARLVYFPAYVIKYTFGEHFNNAGERRPNKHLAIVGGIGATLSSGSRHALHCPALSCINLQ